MQFSSATSTPCFDPIHLVPYPHTNIYPKLKHLTAQFSQKTMGFSICYCDLSRTLCHDHSAVQFAVL